MRDVIGREIQLNDVVATSYRNTQVSLWKVVGFTPHRVVIEKISGTHYNGDVRKPARELVVIPDGHALLEEIAKRNAQKLTETVENA